MPTASDVIAEARKFLGYSESPPGSNCQQFGTWYGTGCAPWCAEYASYVLYAVFGHSPCPAQSAKGFAYCPTGLSWFKAHGQFLPVSTPNPPSGSLVFYAFGGGGVADHVEILISVWPDGRLQTIGGNTGPSSSNNGGEVAEQLRNREPVIGFGVLPYSAPPPPSPPQPITFGSPTSWKEDPVQSVPVHIPALDAQGNGWFLVTGAAGRVISVKFNGADPAAVVGPNGATRGYPPLGQRPAWQSLAFGADEKVLILGGTPNGELDLTVWLAQPAG